MCRRAVGGGLGAKRGPVFGIGRLVELRLREVDPAIALVDDGGTWWQLGEGIAATTLTGPRPALLSWLTARPAGAGLGADALVVTGAGAPALPERPAWP